MNRSFSRLLALLLCCAMLFAIPVPAKAAPPTFVTIHSEAEWMELCNLARPYATSRQYIAEIRNPLVFTGDVTLPENVKLGIYAPVIFEGDLYISSWLTLINIEAEVTVLGGITNHGSIDLRYNKGGSLTVAQPEHYSDVRENGYGEIWVYTNDDAFPDSAMTGLSLADFFRVQYYESEVLPYWVLKNYTATAPAPQHTVVTEPGVAPTCLEYGYTDYSYCSVCGEVFSYREQLAPLGHSYMSYVDTDCEVCGAIRVVDPDRPTHSMYRLYNPNSGEHFYTGSLQERNRLTSLGWKYEGVGFTFPVHDPRPVYRLYDKFNTKDHLYTMDEVEKERLMAAGWQYEGVAFNSSIKEEVPQYRLHNPNATIGAYHFTASAAERDMLIAAGREYQGIGWYSCLQ